MIRENATVINIQFVHIFIKLALPPSLIYGLYRQKIRSFNRLSSKDVGSFMRVSTIIVTNEIRYFLWLFSLVNFSYFFRTVLYVSDIMQGKVEDFEDKEYVLQLHQ